MLHETRSHRGRPSRVEWPTWAALAGCYALWLAGLAAWSPLGVLAFVPLAVAVAFHSSLQHEVLHGHPTRSAALNEALVWLPLGLFIPYRRYRVLHLTHHNDERLTDPYDDPESFYVAEADYARMGPFMRRLLAINATFAGRMLVGPPLALFGFWRAEWRAARAGDAAVRNAWAHHLAGLVPVFAIVAAFGVPLHLYVLLAAWPGMSLVMVRSFIEHRADPDPKRRSAIVEAAGFWRLLFLNNTLHRLHHERPGIPWYELPRIWRAERERILAENGGYLIRGYGEVVRRWLLRPREPVVHPLMRRGGREGEG